MKLVLSCRISLASVIERTLRVEDLFQVHFSDVWMGVRGKQFVAKRDWHFEKQRWLRFEQVSFLIIR
jgi:hypothetical protein